MTRAGTISFEVDNRRALLSCEQLENVHEAVREGIRKTQRRLQTESAMHLVVMPNKGFCLSNMPVTSTVGANQHAFINIDPDRPCYNNRDGLQYLSSSVARTIYQTARRTIVGEDKTINDALVSEGLSHAFERKVLGYPHAQCYVALKKDEDLVFLEDKIRKWGNNATFGGDTDFNHALFFVGGKDLAFSPTLTHVPDIYPAFGGYSMGYALARAWLNVTGMTPIEAIKTPSNEIVTRWQMGGLPLQRVVSNDIIKDPVERQETGRIVFRHQRNAEPVFN